MTNACHLDHHAQEDIASKQDTSPNTAIESMAAGSPVAARQQAILNMQRTKGNAAVQRMLSNSHQGDQIQRQSAPQPQPPASQPTQSGKTPTTDEVMSAIQSIDFSLPGDLQVNLHLADGLVSYPGIQQG